MQGTESQDAPAAVARPTRLLWLNLALGVWLWLLFLTDYSLVGTLPDVVLPFVVLGVALVARRRCVGLEPGVRRRFLGPSLVGGGCYGGCLLLMLVPPFTLGAMFALAEYSGERVVERSTSPDGWRQAVVTFRPVGAYAAGAGRVLVTVRCAWLPGLERDVYANATYVLSPDGESDRFAYVTWVDDDTLRLREREDAIDLGLCGGELPFFLAIPWALLRRSVR